MIFRSLVENLIREPNDSTIVYSLIRELEHDLIAAFEMSRPLVDKYQDMFWQSHSYLDFLIQISNLPSYKKYIQPERQKNKENVYEPVAKENDSNFSYRDNSEKVNELTRKLSECQLKVNISQNETSECQSQLKNLEIELLKSREQVQQNQKTIAQYESDFITCRNQLDIYKKEVAECHDRFLNYDKEKMALQNELLEKQKIIFKFEQEILSLRAHSTNLTVIYNERLKEKDTQVQSLSLQLKSFIEMQHTLYDEIRKIIAEKTEIESHFKVFIDHYNDVMKSFNSQYEQLDTTCSISIQELNENLQVSTVEMIENSPAENGSNGKMIENSKTDNYDSNVEMTSDSKGSCIQKQVMLSSPFDISDNADAISMISEEKSFPGDIHSVIDSLKNFYSMDKSDNEWGKKLLQDLELLNVFKIQMKQLESMAEVVKVTPETFASEAIKLYQSIPQYLNLLTEIATAASLPVDDNIVSEMTVRLNFISELYEPFQNTTEDITEDTTKYKQWLESFPVEVNRLWSYFSDVNEWLSFYSECENLGIYFDVILSYDTLFNDIKQQIHTSLKLMTLEVDTLTFKEVIDNYYENITQKVKIEQTDIYNKALEQWNIEKNVLITKISTLKENNDTWEKFYGDCLTILKLDNTIYTQNDIQKVLDHLKEKMKMLKRKHSEENSENKDKEDSRYRKGNIQNAAENVAEQWNLEKKELDAKILQLTKENSNWITFYTDILTILKLDYTEHTKNVLDYLNEKMKTLKRSHEESEEGQEDLKTRKLNRETTSITFIEIQNLFDALYKEYFRIRWLYFDDTFTKNNPIIENKLEEKIELLDKLKPSIRTSELLKILSQYVTMDLQNYQQENKNSTCKEIATSKDDLLKTVMDSTLKFIQDLKEKETKS